MINEQNKHITVEGSALLKSSIHYLHLTSQIPRSITLLGCVSVWSRSAAALLSRSGPNLSECYCELGIPHIDWETFHYARRTSRCEGAAMSCRSLVRVLPSSKWFSAVFGGIGDK